MFNLSNAEAEGIREKKQQTCDPCLKTLLLFPIIPDGKENAAYSLKKKKSLNERTNSQKNQRQKWDINFPACWKAEISVKDHYFFAASVKKPQMWNTAVAEQVLSFVLHSRTPGLNKQTLECEWTARYMGSDSHPWCVPADGAGILPGIYLTPASWKTKQQLPFPESSFHCSWESFSWRLCWVQTQSRILHEANVTKAGGKMAPGQVAGEGRSHF